MMDYVRCTVTDPKKVMKCNSAMDVVLVLDGTPKSEQKGFAWQLASSINHKLLTIVKLDKF
jgi:hypothetical protein